MNTLQFKAMIEDRHPMLFGSPALVQRREIMAVSLAITAISTLLYMIALCIEGFPFIELSVALLCIHAFVIISATNLNLMFLARYFLVWILIFSTAMVWSLYRGEIYVAPFGTYYQNHYNTSVIIYAGLLSLMGSAMGWARSASKINEAIFKEEIRFSINERRLLCCGLIITFIFSAAYYWKAGGLIGNGKVYADGTEGFDLAFGAYNIFHFIGIALILISTLLCERRFLVGLLLCLISLIPGMLAGSRADFLPQFAIIVMLVLNRTVIKNVAATGLEGKSVLVVIVPVLLMVFYLIASTVALWRTGEYSIGDATLNALDNLRNNLINEIYGHKMLYLETGNMILGGLYSAVVQASNGGGYLMGETYFNYFILTPPAIFGLERPLGLEWRTDIGGERMSQGGIFEIAEAYWNFGFIGCIAVSYGWSYLLGYFMRRGLSQGNILLIVTYLVMGLHGFRCIWYQNFSYYRILTIMMAIYVLGLIWSVLFVRGRLGVQ